VQLADITDAFPVNGFSVAHNVQDVVAPQPSPSAPASSPTPVLRKFNPFAFFVLTPAASVNIQPGMQLKIPLPPWIAQNSQLAGATYFLACWSKAQGFTPACAGPVTSSNGSVTFTAQSAFYMQAGLKYGFVAYFTLNGVTPPPSPTPVPSSPPMNVQLNTASPLVSPSTLTDPRDGSSVTLTLSSVSTATIAQIGPFAAIPAGYPIFPANGFIKVIGFRPASTFTVSGKSTIVIGPPSTASTATDTSKYSIAYLDTSTTTGWVLGVLGPAQFQNGTLTYTSQNPVTFQGGVRYLFAIYRN
jgi:hypothetical protein